MHPSNKENVVAKEKVLDHISKFAIFLYEGMREQHSGDGRLFLAVIGTYRSKKKIFAAMIIFDLKLQ